jgi:hypothetical protein
MARQITLLEWTSLALAVEFLAWHFFFGLAVLSGSLVFTGDGGKSTYAAAWQSAGDFAL